MCGIAGVVTTHDSAPEARIQEALNILRHRGPNHQGYSRIQEAGVSIYLGHTRLSIIDLDERANQPMASDDGNLVLVFNGEIYNYKELRRELARHDKVFKTASDTEVLLKAWEFWGADCLARLDGMFAIVMLNREKRTITCVRDAFGIKPFYYRLSDDGFYFASELPALLRLLPGKPAADLQQGYDYLVHGDYDSTARTFVEGVSQIRPGEVLTVSYGEKLTGTHGQWWRPSIIEKSDWKFDDAVEAVRHMFLEKVRWQMRSDVPLGAALSGGVDSSAIVCAMRKIAPDHPIHTFSYIAAGDKLSEEPWVDLVGRKVDASVHKVVATQEDLIQDINDLVVTQGEPFGSTSVYAQYRVFKLAKENGITVTLDGQGADELLAGYFGYPGYRLLSLVSRGRFLRAAHFANRWRKWPDRSLSKIGLDLSRAVLPDILYSAVRIAQGRNFSPDWLDVDQLRYNGVRTQENRRVLDGNVRGRWLVGQLAYSLQNRGLPALLRHADRSAMKFSIESRVPFLTKDFCNLVLSMPEEYLISMEGETKCVFKAAMRGIVPDEVLDRRDKIGFATPQNRWFNNKVLNLRSWLKGAESISFINSDRLLEHFDAAMKQKSGSDWQVWRWVNYVSWYKNFIG